MAVVNINQILEWFKTGKKPTQAHFWDTWGSFWHKHEGVVVKHPTSSEISSGLKNLEVITLAGNVKIPTSDGYVGSMKDLANSKADLVGGIVPAAQLPSYVDDVIEVANLASLPTTGEGSKIYITIDTNNQYRWSGSSYININQSNNDTFQTVATRGGVTDKEIIFEGFNYNSGEPASTKILADKINIGGPNTEIEIIGDDFGASYIYFRGKNGWIPNVDLFVNGVLNIQADLFIQLYSKLKMPLLDNAQGDSTFTKKLVAKEDGTIGVEDKDSVSHNFYEPVAIILSGTQIQALYVDSVNSPAIVGASYTNPAFLGISNLFEHPDSGTSDLMARNGTPYSSKIFSPTQPLFKGRLLTAYNTSDPFDLQAHVVNEIMEIKGDGGYHVIGKTANDYLMADGSFRKRKTIQDNTHSEITSTSSYVEEILSEFVTPANFLENYDVFEFLQLVSNAIDSRELRVYISNISNSFDSLQLLYYYSVNSYNSSKIETKFLYKNGVIVNIPNDNVVGGGFNVVPEVYNIDITLPIYIITTLTDFGGANQFSSDFKLLRKIN